MTPDLNNLQSLYEKATEGTWEVHHDVNQRYDNWHANVRTVEPEGAPAHQNRYVCWLNGSLGENTPARSRGEVSLRYDPEVEANAEFIVAAHNAMPDLLAELRQLRAERDLAVSASTNQDSSAHG